MRNETASRTNQQMSRLWETFSALTAIDSTTFEEGAFCDALKKRLILIGIESHEDNAGEQIGGNCGNLYAFVPGALPLPPILLSAHMDTVEPGRSKRAVLSEDGVITSNGDTILGADDVAGITVILEALARLKENDIAHRPIELLFPVAEEQYCLGSALFDYDKIQAKESYTLDLSGKIWKAANAAPTILSFEITVEGKAAHSAFAAGRGVHAIVAASNAITKLKLNKQKPGVIVNIGKIAGGTANNIIPALCKVTGEIRSLSHNKALAWRERVQAIFSEEANKVGASITANYRYEITAYETPLDNPAVKRFEKTCEEALGVKAKISSTLGGSDQNNYALHGIKGLVIACSMHDVHSTQEFAILDEMEQCVNLILALVKDGSP